MSRNQGYTPANFPEHDWKHLRLVHRAALERYCERVLRECAAVLDDSSRSAHERYLDLYQLIHERDKAMARAFDDLRRSRAYERLMALWALGVVADEEIAAFSQETQDRIRFLLGLSDEP